MNNHSQHSYSQVDHSKHNKHFGHSIVMFKKRFFISLFLTVPILIFSPLIQRFFNFSLSFPEDKYAIVLISSFIFFYGGWPFLVGAVREIKNKNIGMMTLVSLAISVAYFYSLAVVFGLAGKIFFWELATLIDIMLLGHWIEMKSVMGASMAIEKLSSLIPDNAHLSKGNKIKEVSVSELKDGDVVLVKPGEKIPTDGIVVGGESSVNESMLTGESKPINKINGDKVIGGSINGDGLLKIKVKGIGESSYLSNVINLVKQAQESKSKTQNIADKVAFWLTVVAISIGVITFFAWFLINGDIAFAIERMVTVFVITCPHALGLAVPLVVAISTTLSAKNGLLIRNRTAFENARKISTVVFDKTGTLTEGKFDVSKIYSLNKDYSEDEVIRLFAALDKNSQHSIAKAVVKKAQEKNISLPEVDKFKTLKGRGVEGYVYDKKITIASPGYIQEFGFSVPGNLKDVEGTMIFLVTTENDKNILVGAISLMDSIRKESFEAVKIIKKEGIKIWMLTGDNEISAKNVSEALKLDGYFSGVLPGQKQEKIKELQKNGEFVAMVGDGINDAPALAQADVGIAIGSGTDVAAETADIILINSDPRDISSLILFGKAAYRKMVQNLVWATGYNIFAIPLAAGVLAVQGVLLSPAIGAVLMSLSAIIVAINAKLLNIKI